MRHRPELDGLRGIAVILVIGSHARVPGFGNGAPAGVTLFFVLSGFLITSLLVSERARTGRVDLAAFYMRRALRLFPALYAFLVVVVLGYQLGLWANKPIDPLAIVAVLAYVGNWVQAAAVPQGVVGHTWSLAVEEQFYILWPVVLLFVLRFAGRRPAAMGALILAVLVLPWRELIYAADGYLRAYVGTDVQADALLLGCAIALLGSSLSSRAGWLGIVGLVAVSEYWTGDHDIVYLFSLAAIASALAVAGAPKALGWRPLAYIGRISYGLYLWHYLFIWSGIPWPLAITVSFATAAVSYRYIEQPFLRIKERRFASAHGDGKSSSGQLVVVSARLDANADGHRGLASKLQRRKDLQHAQAKDHSLMERVVFRRRVERLMRRSAMSEALNGVAPVAIAVTLVTDDLGAEQVGVDRRVDVDEIG